jgi:hypothetical protein
MKFIEINKRIPTLHNLNYCFQKLTAESLPLLSHRKIPYILMNSQKMYLINTLFLKNYRVQSLFSYVI